MNNTNVNLSSSMLRPSNAPYGLSMRAKPNAIALAVITRLLGQMLLLAATFASCSSVQADTYGLFTYTDNGTSIEITDYPASATGAVEIPATINGKPVTSIHYNAFSSCSGLTSVTIPEGVTSIRDAAFWGCSGLTSLTIPESMTSIGTRAFMNCTGLTSVTVPKRVTSIGDGPFSVCPRLTFIVVDTDNPNYSSVGGILFNKSKTSLIQYPNGMRGSYSIPVGVTSIKRYAFYESRLLDRVSIPAGVTSIVDHAFYSCTQLAAVTIPDTVTSIGEQAFYFCLGLKSACFIGDAPTMGLNVFKYAGSGFKVCYFNGKAGFTSPLWNGYPAVNMGADSPTKPWLLANGFAFDTNMQTDPNSDGVDLLMAYALNLDPTQNLSGSMPKPEYTANQMRLRFYAGSVGILYSAESSTDLQSWADIGLSAPDASGFRTATVSTTGPRIFMRLLFSQ